MEEEIIIDLDECVINALELFSSKEVPSVDFGSFKKALVVGSGNAIVSGRIIFEKYDAVFCDESTYEKTLDNIKDIDFAIIVSASGGKHAPIIAKELKRRGIRSVLLTNNPDASASEFVSESYVFEKNPEPYTYNTSTYLGMILSYTKENPSLIKDFIESEIKPKIPKNLSEYDSFFFVVPNEFDSAREMFTTKFDELFGSKITGRVFTEDQIKHAKTVVPNSCELFIGLGVENDIWGEKRINFSLPENGSYASFVSIGYYIIGNIQKQNEPFFKDNIEEYTKKVSKLFGQEIKVIVK